MAKVDLKKKQAEQGSQKESDLSAFSSNKNPQSDSDSCQCMAKTTTIL